MLSSPRTVTRNASSIRAIKKALATNRFALFVLPMAFVANATYSAEVAWQSEREPPSIVFRGVVDRASVTKLEALLDRFSERRAEEGPLVLLSSPGGDVYAALEGGRAIRRAKATVFVEAAPASGVRQPSCVSACVFLFAGGVTRLPTGGVAIHNPYVAAAGATNEAVQRERLTMEREIRRFLAEMNVSATLFERMQTIPSNEQRQLKFDELQELGLGMWDPAYQDFRVGQFAAKYGVSKTTYLARFNSISGKCGGPPMPPEMPPVATATRRQLQEHFNRLSEFRLSEPDLLARWQACREEVLAGRR